MKTDLIMRWLKEPLLHFLLLGGLLFAAYAFINPDDEEASRIVHISTAEVNWLRKTWTQQRLRQPDEQELRGLVAGHLKEKLLAHEARELGLEFDDTIVRRRLAQKMEFLVQDTTSFLEPDEEALLRLYHSIKMNYQSPARISFSQIFFRNEIDALHALDKLKVHEATELGDSSLLAPDYDEAEELTVTNVFGPDFFSSVFALESGQWQGPVASAYGFHLVRVKERQSGQDQPFEEVRLQVLNEWRRNQQEKMKKQYVAGLLQKYDIVVDEDVGSLLGPLNEAMR